MKDLEQMFKRALEEESTRKSELEKGYFEKFNKFSKEVVKLKDRLRFLPKEFKSQVVFNTFSSTNCSWGFYPRISLFDGKLFLIPDLTKGDEGCKMSGSILGQNIHACGKYYTYEQVLKRLARILQENKPI